MGQNSQKLDKIYLLTTSAKSGRMLSKWMRVQSNSPSPARRQAQAVAQKANFLSVALAGTNYTVQTVSSLPGGTNWVNYVQLPVTQAVNTNQIIAFTDKTAGYRTL